MYISQAASLKGKIKMNVLKCPLGKCAGWLNGVVSFVQHSFTEIQRYKNKNSKTFVKNAENRLPFKLFSRYIGAVVEKMARMK